MKSLERIGISLEPKLLKDFDKLIAKEGYQNRSEAVRDLIRKELSKEKLDKPDTPAIAVVSLVYDHHSTGLMKKLTNLQHSNLLSTISSMHIHLSHHDCMELIALKGKAKDINNVAQQILSQKGVKLGNVNLIPVK